MFSKFHDYGVLRVLKGVSRVFQGYFKGVFWGCFKECSRVSKGVSRVFDGCFKGVSGMFQWCF